MNEDKILQVNLNKIIDSFKFICIEAFKSKFLWAIFIFIFILSLFVDLQNKNLGLIQIFLFAGVLNIFIKNSKKVFMFIMASVVVFIIFMLAMFMVIFIFQKFNLSSIISLMVLVMVSLYMILFLYFMPFLIFKLKKMQDVNFIDIFKDFLKILVFSLKIKVKNYFKAFLFMILVYVVSIGIGFFLTFIFKENIGVAVSTVIMNILTTAFTVSIASSIEYVSKEIKEEKIMIKN